MVENEIDDGQVPWWQKELLDERERMIEQGQATFLDWETAQKRIADRIGLG